MMNLQDLSTAALHMTWLQQNSTSSGHLGHIFGHGWKRNSERNQLSCDVSRRDELVQDLLWLLDDTYARDMEQVAKRITKKVILSGRERSKGSVPGAHVRLA